jgi:hypothetical protein
MPGIPIAGHQSSRIPQESGMTAPPRTNRTHSPAWHPAARQVGMQ